jgi:hypothetical protein
MDIYTFILELIALIGSLSLGGGFLFFFGIRPQTKRLLEESKKIQLKLNQVRSDMGSEKGAGLIKDALGNVGIAGILEELDIDPGILKNPIVKGIIDRYAPRILEQMSKKGKDGSGTTEIGLL